MQRENLWAPWRMDYIRGLTDDAAVPPSESGCFLCDDAVVDESEWPARLILVRDARGLLLLNRYPYTNGHLLVAPAEHIGDLKDLTPDQRNGMMELAVLGERALGMAMNPQGMNVGMNIGRCAGAGLPGHIHMHILPRWNGDTNFMQTVGQVRVIPQALEESYEMLRDAMSRI